MVRGALDPLRPPRRSADRGVCETGVPDAMSEGLRGKPRFNQLTTAAGELDPLIGQAVDQSDQVSDGEGPRKALSALLIAAAVHARRNKIHSSYFLEEAKQAFIDGGWLADFLGD